MSRINIMLLILCCINFVLGFFLFIFLILNTTIIFNNNWLFNYDILSLFFLLINWFLFLYVINLISNQFVFSILNIIQLFFFISYFIILICFLVIISLFFYENVLNVNNYLDKNAFLLLTDNIFSCEWFNINYNRSLLEKKALLMHYALIMDPGSMRNSLEHISSLTTEYLEQNTIDTLIKNINKELFCSEVYNFSIKVIIGWVVIVCFFNIIKFFF